MNEDYQSAMAASLPPELQSRLLSMFGAQDPNAQLKKLLDSFGGTAQGPGGVAQPPAPMTATGVPGVAPAPGGISVAGGPMMVHSPMAHSTVDVSSTAPNVGSGPIKDPTPVKGPIKFGAFTVDQLKDPKNLRQLQHRRPKAAERYASYIKDNGSKPSKPDKPAPPAGAVPPGAVAKKASSMFDEKQISRLRRRGSVRPGK